MWRWLTLLVCLGVPTLALAGKNLPDFSPDMVIVSGFDADEGRLRVTITQYRTQQIHELDFVGGAAKFTTENVTGPFHEERFLKLKKCKVLFASGEVVPPADYPRRLKVGSVVVLTPDDRPPAKAFLQLLRPETVIVVGPPVKADPRLPDFAPRD